MDLKNGYHERWTKLKPNGNETHQKNGWSNKMGNNQEKLEDNQVQKK